ncbi:hypothetical protein [Vibrio parahaemolyticus]|uniref:hypothetical protein n=1 Tax=Vibrio parahaemolyticus TaxID=670 RepID=UPI0008131127|nr:hypothetical protein [Vibrio parahaemolyticus]OCP68224.1 hypothetical protein AKH08_15515 [Vibrio parahaemolyticus]
MSCNFCEDGWMCVSKCISGDTDVEFQTTCTKRKPNPNMARYLAKAKAKAKEQAKQEAATGERIQINVIS